MLEFFIKHRKVKGVITVFLTLIYLSVYLMIGIFVDGGRVRMANAMIEDVQQIATENVMSGYNRGLFEYYGLFGVNKTTEEISNEVKTQIEQTLGFNVSDDLIKQLLTNVSITNKSSKWEKTFDPYGLSVENTHTTYIDLTEKEAIRSQMRDEMRYKGLMAISENFFAAVSELMSFNNSVEAVKKITEEIDKTNGVIEYANNYYYTSLDNFTNSFKSFVAESYETDRKWVKMASAVKNFFGAVGDFFADGIKNIWSFITGNTEESADIVIVENEVDENGDYNIETNLDLKKDQGLLKTIENNKSKLSRFYDAFDGYNEWPHGSAYVYSDNPDADPPSPAYYHDDEHEFDVSSNISVVAGEYKDKISLIESKLDNALEKLNISISNNEIYRDLVNATLHKFQTNLQGVDEKDKKTKQIYLSYIETYLRQWNTLAEQKKTLDNLKEKMNQLKVNLEQAKTDVDNLCSNILSELSSSWNRPSEKLSTIREPKVMNERNESFHKIMLDMAKESDGLKSVQDTANGDKEQKDIFSVINNSQKENTTENYEKNDKKDKFGEIEPHEESSNKIFNPENYSAEEMKSYKDSGVAFNKRNATARIGKIMDTAKKIIEDLPKSVVDNIYDEAYILTYCRDYVHTYRYLEKGYDKLDDKERKSKNVDIVFNKKFVEDKSSTNYLSNSQLEKLEVTPAEIEYILWGNKDSYLNIAIMYANIFIIRLALNYIAAIISPASAAEIHGLAAASLIFAPIVEVAAPLIYALPQAINETRKIMYECQRVNLYNGGPNLHLWDGIKTLAIDTGKEAIEKARDTAKETYNEAKKNINELEYIDTKKMLEQVKVNASELGNTNINATVEYLEQMIDSDKYKPFISENLSEFDGIVESAIDDAAAYADEKMDEFISNISIVEVEDKLIKTGYSDYLLIYLFLGGVIDKKTQISRLQDIIETNMRKSEAGDDNFRLKDTYSQIAVGTDCSIKFIFMTQSFMTKTFSNTKEYKRHTIKTKTSFAY